MVSCFFNFAHNLREKVLVVCLHICPFANYYFPEMAWKTVELLQNLELEKVIVPPKLLHIGRTEYEIGDLKTSEQKLGEFIEIFSEKYTIVLSHNALDVIHFRSNYNSILKNISSSNKAYFFEEKFAEISEFLLKLSPLPFKVKSSEKPINLILNYDAGVNHSVNLKTELLLNEHQINFRTLFVPNLISMSVELDYKKMNDFARTIKETNVDLYFNDFETLFFVQSFSNANKLNWKCKYFLELFEIEK